jgi:endonuclease YncB( thermonuclease family)
MQLYSNGLKALLLFLPLTVGFPAFAELDETLSVKDDCKHDTHFRCILYVKAHDGDTITIEIPNVPPIIGHNISVRIKGIDAPEISGHGACERQQARIAQELVEKVLSNAKRIDLINIERDKYFRLLADVIADGKSLSQIIMNAHLAYSYNGGTKQKINWCEFNKKRVPAKETSP